MPLYQDINEIETLVAGLSGSYGSTNDTTPILLVGPPASFEFIREIKQGDFTIKNIDTGIVTFKTYISNSSGQTIIDKIILNPGDKWYSSDRIIINDLNTSLFLTLLNTVQSTQLVWNVVFNEISKG